MADRFDSARVDGGNYDQVAVVDKLLAVYADDFLFDTIEAERWMEFAEQRYDLMVQGSGDTIKWIKVDDLAPTADVLTGFGENEDVETVSGSTSSISMDIYEFAKAVGLSERLLKTSAHDEVQLKLTTLARFYAKFGPNHLLKHKAIVGDGSPTRVGSTIYANGKAARHLLAATDYMDVELISDAVEVLQTNNVPKFMNDHYVCIVHPHQVSRLQRDPDWQAYDYRNGANRYRDEIGRWQDVIFIADTTLYNGAAPSAQPGFLDNGSGENAYAAGVDPGTGSDNVVNVYTSVIMGPGYLGWAWMQQPELRTDSDGTNFARRVKIAYTYWGGATVIQENHGLVLETA